MKVYLFDPTSGLYEGEDFWESGEVREAEGATGLEPPLIQQGQLPVYNRRIHTWQLIPTDKLKRSVGRND